MNQRPVYPSPDKRPALPAAPVDPEADWFAEELQLMRITMTRLFRNASTSGQQLPPTVEVEDELATELGEDVTEALTELDEARDGKDAVTAEIAKWREELAA